MAHRIVTYNVLSPNLCSPSEYPYAEDSEYCTPAYRWGVLVEKLTKETDQKSIICLQEVSLAWSADLNDFFRGKAYRFIYQNYGSFFNGYMGVAIAYPHAKYHLHKTHFTCVADEKTGGWKVPKAPFRFLALLEKLLWCFFVKLLSMAGKKPATPTWEIVKFKKNVMVTLNLGFVVGSKAKNFLVATYHAPCVFEDPAATVVNTALALQVLERLSNKEIPYILVGDFNMKPNSPAYELATKGGLTQTTVNDPEDEEMHGKPCEVRPLYQGDPFKLRVDPVVSAYAAIKGKEPLFTYHAQRVNKKKFSSVLDYVFFRNVEQAQARIKVENVLDLAGCDKLAVLDSLPSKSEPSDHVMIGMEFNVEKME